ncbi:metal-dependent hydrolase [Natrialba sp. SSL1]|uniref:metal-dependent hydrolase n=1 Tax=Natrialba sp. SSL1 TaxID=1869245 RepID=UPI0008F7F8B7|nr:metal-dependent hydrolase [Natrialba sp. SSL1]OIB56533.1 metal-dependent hydrolase [Natrialba sp. SSL1]
MGVSAVADVLTHVLAGYVIGTLLSMRYGWMRPVHVTLVMIGALVPDFVKVELLLPDPAVSFLLGSPFSWAPLHTLVGTLIVALFGSLFVAPELRRQALALIVVGVVSHHILDIVLVTATGYSYAVFWPISDYRFPAADLFLSSDRWPALVAGVSALVVWLLSRWSADG